MSWPRSVDGDDAAGAGDRGAVDGRQGPRRRKPITATVSPAGRWRCGSPRRCRWSPRSRSGRRGPAACPCDRDAGVLVDQHLFGEGRQVQILVHVAAIEVIRGSAPWRGGCRGSAQRHVGRSGTGRSGRNKADRQVDDVVAHLDRAHFGPRPVRRRRPLSWPSNRRQREGVLAFHEVEGRSGRRRRRRCGSALVRPGLPDLDVLDLQGLANFTQTPAAFHLDVLQGFRPATAAFAAQYGQDQVFGNHLSQAR